MIFRQILHEEKPCLSYIVGCPNEGVCATVDAQVDPKEYMDLAKKLGLKITVELNSVIGVSNNNIVRKN